MNDQQGRQPNPAQERRNRIIAAIKEQQETIEVQAKALMRQDSQIGFLTNCLATMAGAAGLHTQPKFAHLMRQAGLQVRADTDTNNSPSGAPATSTEEAKKPDATDDVEDKGAAPGAANSGVTPEGVTDVNNSDVTANPPVLDNLQDVTKPTSGTDAVVPAAGDAGGTSQVSVGTPSGDSFDGPAFQNTSSRGDEQERFVASMRLARLRIESKIEQGEDLALAQQISASKQTLGEINAQIETLDSVSQARQASAPSAEQRRRLVPQSQQRQAGIAPLSQPSFQTVSAVESRPGEDEWMVGSIED